MAKINLKCDCGSKVTASVGDSLYEGILRWYVSYKCESCGRVVESDGRDEIPSEIKEAILKDEGIWKVILHDRKEFEKVSYILRKQFGFTLGQTKEIDAKLSNELISGTKNEMSRINDVLTEKGVKRIEIKKV
ncbi:hypothetical protein JHL18_15025 [Clostridium sp. YIM B02505]|uniref:Uncharacterized protein n=1 Tax=Clostridium yunnanense TaxID=2800325 RepID=A0ABS1ERD2_9CLOT|nr:hypothetical protein [Clostridium yunnanense]MBK1811932.1 hypothetical protein [Clostridium yunnanense]